MPEQKPPRRMVRTWADGGDHITRYDASGRPLMLCAQCVLDPDPNAVLNQAVTIYNGTALCEWHLYPKNSQPSLDPALERLANGD